MEPKIGTNAYLLHIMNPFRRPMCLRYINNQNAKILAAGGVLLFAIIIVWSLRNNGLLAGGVWSLLSAMWLLVIAIHIEGFLRLYAISKSFEARLRDWKTTRRT